MSFKIIRVHHRHCVFTIDENLREYFYKDRTLLNCLFSAVNSVLTQMFHKDNKTELFTPGFILVLHTFGRDLKWNPHIHCLISEGGIGKSGMWRAKTHFNYNYLRNAFRTALLNELEKQISDPSFKKVKSSCYRNHEHGFYVYAKPNKCDPKTVTKYIGRYLGRPVIATSRIDKYDGEMVTFHYNRHEDNKYVDETIPALEFIERLIRHIPEKHFKMIRYYGIYAQHKESLSKLNRSIKPDYKKYILRRSYWRNNIFISFGYAPLKCPNCGETMSFQELRYNHKHISLEEMYNKVMAKTTRAPA